ncbi:hypothetical protein [Hydrogenophaga sp.]|uniref:hypothetical protein n=1 Tax=Hydrogenophaga sp. TaxID=1904254 RepID=UPI0025BCEB5A|nr:hypothetical protein [Hydrogenophaga sp.]
MQRRQALSSIVAAVLGAATTLCMAQAAEPQQFPNVLAAKVRASGGDRFDFDVTVSSPYDSPARYADGIRARSPEGLTYGVRKLWHDHAAEQPFTRDLYGVKVPPGVTRVVIEARDQLYGYRGKALGVELPGR